ncbi:MAG TPA: nucleotidyltransferase domain-containing protein [Myxococcaceae bacterium]|jgi:predicted nucleotidyltransferase
MVLVEPRMDDAAAQEIEACRAIAAGHEGLELLVLFGSRARGEARQDSDWDFGYLADERFDPLDLLPPLVTALGTDRIDLVDLRKAGALLRFRAVRDGRPIFEARPGRFQELQLEAADFWCDVEPVLRRAYDALLSELVP